MAPVHELTHIFSSWTHGWIDYPLIIFLMTYEGLRTNIVFEELLCGYEIICWNKVTSFWYSQVVEVWAVTPVTTYNLTIFVSSLTLVCSIDPINLSTFTPKTFFICKVKLMKPVVLRFWSILCIEFSRVNQQWYLLVDKILYLACVVL